MSGPISVPHRQRTQYSVLEGESAFCVPGLQFVKAWRAMAEEFGKKFSCTIDIELAFSCEVEEAKIKYLKESPFPFQNIHYLTNAP